MQNEIDTQFVETWRKKYDSIESDHLNYSDLLKLVRDDVD
jgi:hypothetical protein